MTETPQIPEETLSSSVFTGQNIIGTLVLALIFCATTAFTWSYLSETTTPALYAQTASAVVPVPSPSTDVFADIQLQAQSAIVVDTTTGQTLFEHRADIQLPLASLTKVALALAASQVLEPDLVLTIPYDTAPEGSFQRLGEGQRWKVRDVIDFTLAVSSNAGADILARAADSFIQARYPTAPDTDATLWRMNKLVRELNLSRTYFLNTTGLDESPTQAGAFGSARDVATLFAYAASSSPHIFSATTKESFKMKSIDGAQTSAINTDEALPAITGIVMGKTGYTDLAGGNLAVTFDEAGHRIVAVVLGSTMAGRFEDMKTLVALTKEALVQ